jgi:hypothetical protein
MRSLVFSKFDDAHDRVKYAACHALGQLSTDFSSIIQEKYSQPVITSLVKIMKSQCSDRVKAHASAAMINFCDECDPEVLSPFLDQILEAILGLLHSSKMFMLEQVLSTLSTVADAASNHFEKVRGTHCSIKALFFRCYSASCCRQLTSSTPWCVPEPWSVSV